MEKYFECRKHMFETKLMTLSYNDDKNVNLDYGRHTGKTYFHMWLMNKFETENIPYMSIFQNTSILNFFRFDYRQYGCINKNNIKMVTNYDFLSCRGNIKYVILDTHQIMNKMKMFQIRLNLVHQGVKLFIHI